MIPGDLLVGDEAGHGGDEGAQATQVRAHQQCGPIFGKAGQEQRRGDIAEDLTGQHGAEDLVPCQEALDQIAKDLQPP